jgi:hypothetical protein
MTSNSGQISEIEVHPSGNLTIFQDILDLPSKPCQQRNERKQCYGGITLLEVAYQFMSLESS